MPTMRKVKTFKEAEALRLEIEVRLVELLEKRLEQVARVIGTPAADVLGFEIDTQRQAYEAARVIESRFRQDRQFWVTLGVAGVAAFATVVYAVTFVWSVASGRC